MAGSKLVFRIFNGGQSTNSDWHGSTQFPYDSTNRANILVGNGDKASDEITSIPSPFARIDIAKNAFREVCKLGLDGKTIFHKTVSDVLDVGEIFFNYDKFKDLVEIIKWDPANIQSLLNSPVNGNRYLGESLDSYLKADAKTYNFSSTQNIYILRWINGRTAMDVIGATSTATMFFSSANDLSAISSQMSFGQDHPFDNDYAPLYKREKEYIKFWCIMRARIPAFSTLMPEVDEYLNLTIQKINDPQTRNELFSVGQVSTSEYQPIPTSQGGNTVEVFGVPLVMKVMKPVTTSEFTIKPTKADVQDVLPLVLPCEAGNSYKDFLYTQGEFGKEAHAPYVENSPLGSRKLPFDGRTQDYLSISDFLEDYIIKVPHKLNSDHYFQAMTFTDTEGSEEYSYLLPLKSLFFKYFNAEDLVMPMQPNQLGIQMEKSGDGVSVTLQIPVIGHGNTKVIKFDRVYSGTDPKLSYNKGAVETFDFDAFIMPLVRDADVQRSFYTVGCVSTKTRNYDFTFFAGERALQANSACRNTNSKQDYKAVSYALKGTLFDYIQVSNADGKRGLIIPLFHTNNRTSAFHFSIDVGTSNTHISYVKDRSSKIEDFHYGAGSAPMCTVFVPTQKIVGGAATSAGLVQEEEIMLRDFLPQEIGNGSYYKFPTRTVLTCAKSFKLGQNSDPFGLYNASMTYDKVEQLDYNRDLCNIKWDSDENALKYYISCLLLMIRNHVLLADGDLTKTEVTWFFPTSMPMKRKNHLKQIWDELYEQYFGKGSTSYMTESAAPVYYLFATQARSNDVVSVDIGGGTTDIAFAKQKDILAVSSFRFASNDLFQNSLAPDNLTNGIVSYFKDILFKNIDDNDETGMKADVMQPLFEEETHSNPANMASFLFSLKDNINLEDLNKDVIDFNKLLNADENFKIVFILFYTAILYHIGKIIKFKDFNIPGIISFSGNGSKLLNVITTNSQDLADYTRMVLEAVSGKKSEEGLEIVGLGKDDDPKTSTCKGGLKVQSSSLKSDPNIALEADGKAEISEETTLGSIDANDNYQAMVVDSVKDFFNLALDYIPKTLKYSYDDHFGVTAQSLEIARAQMEKGLSTYLKKGVSLLIEDSDPKERVSQTMFFIPVKGVLNDISAKIYDSLS
jgi:hypothetical protein